MTQDITTDPVFQSEDEEPARPAKKPAGSVLEVPRPTATRYKRSFVIAGVGGIATVIAGSFLYSFGSATPKLKKADAADNVLPTIGKPEIGDKLPNNYTESAAYAQGGPGTAALPPTGPNNAQGAQQANGGQAQPSQGGAQARPAAYSERPMTPAQQRAAQARDLAIQQEMAARSGNIMFGGGAAPSFAGASFGGGRTAPTTDEDYQTPSAPAETNRGATVGGLGRADQNQQGDKQQFIAQARIDTDYVESRLQAPRSKFEVKAGSMIAGALLTALNSDLPGEVVATVTQNVYDHVTGRYLLIPQGARLIGRYDSSVSYKQSRALVVWNRIIFPNGYSINIGTMTGTDGTGASGVSDRVNNHFGGKAGAALLSTAIALGAAAAEGAGTRDNQLVTAGGGALSQQASQIGGEIISRELGRQPTITIRPGFRIRVLVNKDMILEPYRSGRPR